MPDLNTQQRLPQQPHMRLNYDEFTDRVSESGSDGSAEMSIELGRGVKRGTSEKDDSFVANPVFNMGNGSMYELVETPPIRSRAVSRKTDDGLRREASVRRAISTTHNNAPLAPKPRSLSAAIHKAASEDGTSYLEEVTEQSATLNTRNTRFTRVRAAPANVPAPSPRFASAPAQMTPRKNTNRNATAQSNSFVLPELPDITELVSGSRKDGTPVFNQNTKSRSRFTSASHNPATKSPYHRVESITVPEDEKAIYASLQLLKERVDQLEMEKSEALRLEEEKADEIISLRHQIALSQRRPDSGLGSSDEDGSDRWKAEKVKLQASVKQLQEQLNRADRKFGNAEITVKRVVRERDELVTQIGVAYYNNEELKADNEALQHNQSTLTALNQELQQEVDALRQENQELQMLVEQIQRSHEADARNRATTEARLKPKADSHQLTAREVRQATRRVLEAESSKTAQSKDTRYQSEGEAARRRSLGVLDEATQDDLASRIAQEVRKHHDQAAATATKQNNGIAGLLTRQQDAHSTSRSQQRDASMQYSASNAKRTASGPTATVDDEDTTTHLDFTAMKSRNNSKRASLPAPAKPAPRSIHGEDTRDITVLSHITQDDRNVRNLRQQLEEERIARRHTARSTSAPEGNYQASEAKPRKSSIREAGLGSEAGTERFNLEDLVRVTKNVRVQSPHSSDVFQEPAQQQQSEAGDTSMLSNTSRRRRRAASADEGMTSAFILPDITLHNTAHSGIKHDTANCTYCPHVGQPVSFPTPVPVTDRTEDLDMTTATVRPSEPPHIALATVIKQFEDEIKHLKIELAVKHRMYSTHDPALAMRRRVDVKDSMDALVVRIERRSNQVYSLYDVLEGQKAAATSQISQCSGGTAEPTAEIAQTTLEDLGIDLSELDGRVG